ncbi:MAG: TraB/GumN family protein [Dyella sp.]
MSGCRCFRVAAALLLTLCSIGVVSAKPALWMARQGQSTVYLLGTVHLLPSDTNWSSRALDEALRHSDDLTLELTDDDPANMRTLITQYGVDADHPLSSKLSTTDQAKLAQAAAAAKLPGGVAMLQPMQPWLAALTLTMAPLMQAGLDPSEGVDKVLKGKMQAAGKPIHGLETAEQQLRLLAKLPQPQQVDFLRQSFDQVSDGVARVRQLIDAWKRGDVAAIARIEDNDLRQDSPALYQSMVVARNRAWAQLIAQRMRQPGVHFIAVGAAHLAGPDSLQVQMEKLGIAVQRAPDAPPQVKRAAADN